MDLDKKMGRKSKFLRNSVDIFLTTRVLTNLKDDVGRIDHNDHFDI